MTSFKDHLREHCIDQDVQLHQKMPLPTQNGGVTFPSIYGKLLHVFDDGVVIRASEGELYWAWADIYFLSVPSKISTAAAGLNLAKN